jgi:hypothetical protein
MALSYIDEVLAEHDAQSNALDLQLSENDWIAFITAYAGRAARGVRRNERENQTYRANLVKVGGLVLSALAAYDVKNSKPETDAEPAKA